MEQIIAIILVIIMIIIDYFSIEKFINWGNCNNTNKKYPVVLEQQPATQFSHCNSQYREHFMGKINIWVLDNRIISPDNIRSKNNNIPITDICLESIKKHIDSSKYNLNILDLKTMTNLLPEYKCYISECKNTYVLYNFLKYAILNKFGGIWIPSDTLLLNSIIYDYRLLDKSIITYGKNNVNIVDNKGYSDTILGSSKNHPIISKIIQYFKSNLNTFQNSVYFKKSINKFFNKCIINYKNHIHKESLIEKTSSGKFITLEDIFTTNYLSIEDFYNKNMLHINIDHINEFHKYQYILNMSKKDLIESNLFISYIIKKALN